MFKALFTTQTDESPVYLDLEKTAVAAYHKGNALFNEGNYQEAIDNYENFIKNCQNGEDPQNYNKLNWKAHCQCGIASLRLGKLPRALGYFDNAIAIQQNSKPLFCKHMLPDLYERRGFVLLLLGEFNRALLNFNEAKNLRKKHQASNLFYCGILKFLTGNHGNAYEDIKASFELDKSIVSKEDETLRKMIKNKDLPLQKDAENIIAFLEMTRCSMEQHQKPSFDFSASNSVLIRKAKYTICYSTSEGKNEELMRSLINREDTETDQISHGMSLK